MHQRAGRAIKAVLEGASMRRCETKPHSGWPASTSRRVQLDDALQALARIKGAVPEEIRGDVEFLRANVYMATGQPSEAVKVLAQLKSNERLAGLLPTTLASHCCRTADHRKRSSNWTRPGNCRPVIPPVSRSATSRTWCWAPCCSNLAILSGPDSHWTASISRDRSRTRPCSGRAGPRLGPAV